MSVSSVGQIKSGICNKDCVAKDGTIKTLLLLSRNQTNDVSNSLIFPYFYSYPIAHLFNISSSTVGNFQYESNDWKYQD